MWNSSYDLLAELLGGFWGNSIYSESLSLSPELTVNMTSLSGFAGILGVVVGPSIGCDMFEFILPLPLAAGVSVLGSEVLVSVWVAKAAPERSGKAGHNAPSVMTLVVNSGSYG